METTTMGYIGVLEGYMEGCQNYGPFLGTLYIRGRIIIGTQKGTIILTTTHVQLGVLGLWVFGSRLSGFKAWSSRLRI